MLDFLTPYFASPVFLFIFGAIILPFLPKGSARGILTLIIPIISGWWIWNATEGLYGLTSIGGLDIPLMRVDRLSTIFGLIFSFAAFIAALYAWHIRDAVQQIATLLYAGTAIGAVFAGDLISLFVYWEGTALASVFLMLILAFVLEVAGSVVSRAENPVVVGVLAHRGPDVALKRWQPTIDQLRLHLPQHQFKLLALSLEGVYEALERGSIDFLLTNPGHYISIADLHRLTPLASLITDRTGMPVTGNRYGAVIFVQAGREDLRTLADLKDKTFAGVAPGAFGGFLAAARTFQRNGIDPFSELKAIKFMGFPQDEIVKAVLRGEEDAGTVRTGVLESMIADQQISPDDIRILNPQKIAGFELMLSTKLFPEWTFAAAQTASPKLRKMVVRVLFAIDENHQTAISGQYGGWNTPMYDGNVRQLFASVEQSKNGRIWNFSRVAMVIMTLFASLVAVYYFFGRSLGLKMPARASHFDNQTFLRLTRRENQVLGYVVSGMTNKQTARELEISPKTVEFHRMHLMKKLKADSLADLVRIALERNIVGYGSKPRVFPR
ncbi:MAG: PhnD/SsuA/transferrin family substrate-binding protein [Rhizobiaceae bacterium]|nr:PhnD/SsuA/transferrin family substrate-binding protein [Rhizobiaceae bacterium]